jgi:hypothetical protein
MRQLAKRRLFLLAVLWLCPVDLLGQVVATSEEPERWLTTVSSPRAMSRLIGINDQQQFVFDRHGQQQAIAVDELVMWGSYSDRNRGTAILLVDGGILAADLMAIQADSITVVGRLWPETRLPREHVQAILLRIPSDSLRRDRTCKRAFSDQRAGAQLLLENGDELDGDLVVPVRAEPGGFRPTALRWRLPGSSQPMVVPLDRSIAILFKTATLRPKNEPPLARLTAGESNDRSKRHPTSDRSADVAARWQWLGLHDGSRLAVTRMFREKNVLQLNLKCGTQLTTASTSTESPWSSVMSIQSFGPQVTYLSDLEPLSYKQLPYLDLDWPYQRDQSISGGRLRHGRQVFAKGLGMHSNSRLTYELSGRYRRFQAELAIDQRAGRDGSVVFRIYTKASNDRWNKTFQTDIVRGAQAPIHIDVDVGDVQQMALIIDAADRADEWDHANWLNARLFK